MLVQITPENKENFKAVVPEELLACFTEEGDVFGIGIVGELTKPPYAALVFQTVTEAEEEDQEHEEPQIHAVADLKWVYVEEEARQLGMATELFSELLELLNDTETEAIRCDVPMDADYNLFCGMLEDFGFSFELTERFTFTRPLRTFAEHHLLQQAIPPTVRPLSEQPEKELLRILGELAQKEELADFDLTGEKEDYDEEVSCVLIEGKDPAGLLLARPAEPGVLELVFLDPRDDAEDRKTQVLLTYAWRTALKKYGRHLNVRICVKSDAGGQLLEQMFPDAEPLLLRRGYFYL